MTEWTVFYHFMCHKFFEMILHDLNLDAVVLNSANLFKEGNSENLLRRGYSSRIQGDMLVILE